MNVCIAFIDIGQHLGEYAAAPSLYDNGRTRLELRRFSATAQAWVSDRRFALSVVAMRT